MFSVEHASSMGPAVMEEGGEQQASCLVAKQAVEFPQVVASCYNYIYCHYSYCGFYIHKKFLVSIDMFHLTSLSHDTSLAPPTWCTPLH